MHPKRTPDWLLRAICTTALAMLVKLNTRVASLDTRVAVLETKLEFMPPENTESLILPAEERSPLCAAVGFFVPNLCKGSHDAQD